MVLLRVAVLGLASGTKELLPVYREHCGPQEGINAENCALTLSNMMQQLDLMRFDYFAPICLRGVADLQCDNEESRGLTSHVGSCHKWTGPSRTSNSPKRWTTTQRSELSLHATQSPQGRIRPRNLLLQYKNSRVRRR